MAELSGTAAVRLSNDEACWTLEMGFRDKCYSEVDAEGPEG